MIELENLYDLTQKDPDRTLYLAIILQALLDLTKPKDKEDTMEIITQRDQASAWVFASVGVTCKNFEDTCDLAGINPNTIRNFALKAATSENIHEIRRKLHSFL
tara:strand:- start:185 stop:496 length:312 start_codon:yes stop_codon:yes gene_type:complete